MAEEEKQEKKIPGWATRLPFGLCKRYGITLPDNATPRDAWNALKGRGVTRQEVYESIRENAKPTGNDKGAKEEQEQDSKKTVEAFMSNDRIKVSAQNREALQKCFEAGTKEMQSVTSRLFIEDSYSYNTKSGTGKFSPIDNVVRMEYAYGKKGNDPTATFYHESWHAIDYNYGEISQEDIKRELSEKNNELTKLYLARKIHPSYHTKKTKENMLEAEAKMYTSCSYKLSTGKTFKETLLEETKGRGKELLEDVTKKFQTDKENFGYEEAVKNWLDMSDIVEGLTKYYSICGGHGNRYWDNAGNSRAKEAFAEIASSKATNQKSYDIIKSYLPKTVAAFEELYKKISKGEIPRRQT